MEEQGTTVYTVGHSTRTAEEFLALLETYGIRLLADVRTVPRSRHNPQFNADELERALTLRGIGYRHLKGLGGLRHPRRDSPNAGWRNDSFRGYADYMLTPVFSTALEELVELAARETTAVMCAEAVPWRCHRSLIGDALTVRGVRVIHIHSPRVSKDHRMTRMARVDGLVVTYPPETETPGTP